MDQASEDVFDFSHITTQHFKKVWSTQLLERDNAEIKYRSRVVGTFPNATAIIRLVDSMLMEQDEHCQLEGQRICTAASINPTP